MYTSSQDQSHANSCIPELSKIITRFTLLTTDLQKVPSTSTCMYTWYQDQSHANSCIPALSLSGGR